MKKVILLFFVWRLVTLSVTLISPMVLPVFGGKFPYYNERLIASGLPHFLWSLGNFDGVHYIGIADGGYFAQFTQAFFPLYPMLIWLGAFITGGNLLISGLIVSNVAFFAAILLFYKLLEKKYDKKVAIWSVVMLLSFPTSFFFGSVYTEGIFFLLIIAFFLLEHKGRYGLASVVGIFASATRLIGVFLSPAIWFGGRGRKIYAFVPLLGLFLYMGYLKFKFDNPLYFLTSQSAFGQGRETGSLILLPQVFYRYLKIFLTTHGTNLIIPAFEFSVTILCVSLAVIAFWKTDKRWAFFALASIILPTLTGTLTSMPRYVLVAFPIFVVMAMIKNVYLKLAISLIFCLMGIVALTFFSQGYWIA